MTLTARRSTMYNNNLKQIINRPQKPLAYFELVDLAINMAE